MRTISAAVERLSPAVHVAFMPPLVLQFGTARDRNAVPRLLR
jgi:hypothetical protein